MILLLSIIAFGAYLAFQYLKPTHFSVRGKHVVITGGSSGLGLSLARLILKLGGEVTLISRREEILRRVCDDLLQEFSASHINFYAADMSDNQQTCTAMKHIYQKKAIDILFCCAGGAKPGKFIEQTADDFEAGMKTNYFSSLFPAHVIT